MEELIMLILMIPGFVITTATFLMVPGMSKSDIYFGIRMPGFLKKREDMISIKKKFDKNTMLYSLGIIFLYVVGYYFILRKNMGENIQGVWFVIMLLFHLSVLQLLYYVSYKKVKSIKEEEKDLGLWIVAKKIVIVDTKLSKEIKKMSYWWLIPVIIVFIQVILVVVNYDKLPQRLPMHYNMGGEVDSYMNKTPLNSAIMPLVSAGMVILMYVMMCFSKTSKKEINSLNMEKSRIQLRLYYYYMEIFMVICASLICLTFVLIEVSMIGYVSSQSMTIGTLLLAAIIVIIAIIFSIKVGQSGSKIKVPEIEDCEAEELFIDKEDDKYWIMGCFYYNKDDPSLMIEKRAGTGWTINTARPVGLIILIAPIIVSIIVCVVSFMNI